MLWSPRGYPTDWRLIMDLRDASEQDLKAILSLNRAWEHYLSPLDLRRLARLHEQADQHRVVDSDGEVVAFLLAFREGCDYDSANYRWFADRYERFLYIDRVVVSGRQQGQGLGRTLYEDLFSRARVAGIDRVCCEFDLSPPNPASQVFHEHLGFEEVGTQHYGNTGKQVSLRIRQI
jgi:uncharacterized protein